MTRDLTKRDLLRIGIVSAGSVFTGCMTTASESSEQQITIPDEPPCADDLQIKQIAATVGGEVHPVVELQVENQGSNPISYELQVIFEQGTSLGIDARTGRSTVTETVDGGEIITHQVSDNARDIKNTDSYIVNVVAVNCQDERT
jgi:hypothetical protein